MLSLLKNKHKFVILSKNAESLNYVVKDLINWKPSNPFELIEKLISNINMNSKSILNSGNYKIINFETINQIMRENVANNAKRIVSSFVKRPDSLVTSPIFLTVVKTALPMHN